VKGGENALVHVLAANNNGVLEMDRLLEQYGDSLLRLCFLYLKDRYLAEDAVHDTLIKAYEGYAKFRGDSSEKTWLTSIAVNVYSLTRNYVIHSPRIFVARRCGKTAGMLVAFQGFAAPHGDKKTGAGMA